MKYIFLILLSTSLLLYSCDKLDEYTQFNIDLEENVNIPASTVVNIPLDIISPDIETNYEEIYQDNNTSLDLIESVSLSDLKITINAPKNGNFDFVKSFEFYLSAEGQDRVLLAEVQDLPDGVTELSPEISDVDLKPYIESESVKFQLKVVTDKVLSTDHELHVYIQALVDAKILGV